MMRGRRLSSLIAAAAVLVAIAACSTSASTSPVGTAPSPAPPGESGGASAPGSDGGGSGGGGDGFEGSLASSGLYTANWTVAPETAANPMNAVNNPTLTSDKGTFGNIRVETDGSVKFGSAASELNANSSYDGTGATVTLDATGQFVCSFRVDGDLKGNHDGAVLRMSGGLTVHWHPGGDLNCP